MSDTLPHLIADEVRVKQILINLLTNAVKYTPVGGHVELSVLLENDGGLSFCVSDTGIGMAADEIPRALEPFGQVGDIMTNENEGVGLGLYLTRTLIELHQGRLEIESMPGQGTTIGAYFPPERTKTLIPDAKDPAAII